MKFLKRAFPFLLLNIVVSAATTFAVLYLWNRAHPVNLPNLPPQVSSEPLATPLPTPTLPPLDTPLVQIDSVIAAGDLANEEVVLRLAGEQEALLNGWSIVGSGGNQYTLPNLLFKGGEIHLYSGSRPAGREESAGELYWNREKPAWRSGETINLLDPLGGVRATYTIP